MANRTEHHHRDSNPNPVPAARRGAFSRRGKARRFLASVAAVLAILLVLGGPAQAANPIDSLLNIVKSVRKSVEAIVKRLPDNPKMRGLAGKFNSELVDNLGQLVDNVRDDAIEIVKLVKKEKQKIQSFENGGGPARVKGYLDAMLQDFRGIVEDSQKFACVVDPRAPQVPIDVQLMRDAVGLLPPLALYAAEAVLNQINPQWHLVLGELHALIPSEGVGELCGMELSEFRQEQCAVIEELPVQDLGMLQLQIAHSASMLSTAKEFIPDDVEATIGAVAVGGAAAGTKVELLLKPSVNAIEVALGELNHLIDFATELQDSCTEASDRIERDLLSCTALATYVYDFEAVQNLAERRLASIGDYHGGVLAGQTRDFHELCELYQQRIYGVE